MEFEGEQENLIRRTELSKLSQKKTNEKKETDEL